MLGLDSPDRVRLTEDGRAVLAFRVSAGNDRGRPRVGRRAVRPAHREVAWNCRRDPGPIRSTGAGRPRGRRRQGSRRHRGRLRWLRFGRLAMRSLDGSTVSLAATVRTMVTDRRAGWYSGDPPPPTCRGGVGGAASRRRARRPVPDRPRCRPRPPAPSASGRLSPAALGTQRYGPGFRLRPGHRCGRRRRPAVGRVLPAGPRGAEAAVADHGRRRGGRGRGDRAAVDVDARRAEQRPEQHPPVPAARRHRAGRAGEPLLRGRRAGGRRDRGIRRRRRRCERGVLATESAPRPVSVTVTCGSRPPRTAPRRILQRPERDDGNPSTRGPRTPTEISSAPGRPPTRPSRLMFTDGEQEVREIELTSDDDIRFEIRLRHGIAHLAGRHHPLAPAARATAPRAWNSTMPPRRSTSSCGSPGSPA